MKTWLTAFLVVALGAGSTFGETTTPSTQKRDWEKRFKKMDTNNDGKLTLEEFLAGPMGQKTPKKARGFFLEIDKGNTGFITLEQWMAAHSDEAAQEPTATPEPSKPEPPPPAESAPATAERHGNLFVNGSLEQGLKGWEFSTSSNPRTPKSVMTLDNTVLHEGKPSLRIDSAAAGSSGGAYQSLKLKANTVYRVSAYVRTKDVKVLKPGIQVVGAAVGFFGGEHSKPLVGTTDDWKKVSHKFNTQSETTNEVSLFLGIYPAPVVGSAWFADMTLVEVGAPKK